MNFPNDKLIVGYWLVVVAFIISAACFFQFRAKQREIEEKAFLRLHRRRRPADNGMVFDAWWSVVAPDTFIPVYLLFRLLQRSRRLDFVIPAERSS